MLDIGKQVTKKQNLMLMITFSNLVLRICNSNKAQIVGVVIKILVKRLLNIGNNI